MSELLLKDLFSDRNKKCKDQIIHILYPHGGIGLKKKDICKIGKKIYKNDFPKDPNTVYRYLRTMRKEKIVKLGKGKMWSLIDPYKDIGKIIGEIDIEILKDIIQSQKEMPLFFDVLSYEDIGIYGYSSFTKFFFEGALDSIIRDIRYSYSRLYTLDILSIFIVLFISLEEIIKDAKDFEKKIMRFIIHLSLKNFVEFTIPTHIDKIIKKEYKLSKKTIEEIKKSDTVIKTFLNIADIVISQDEVKNIPYFYYDKGSYKIKTEDIHMAAKLFQKNYCPEKTIEEIIIKFKGYELHEQYSKKVNQFINNFKKIYLTRIKSDYPPILVLNPKRSFFRSTTQYLLDIVSSYK